MRKFFILLVAALDLLSHTSYAVDEREDCAGFVHYLEAKLVELRDMRNQADDHFLYVQLNRSCEGYNAVYADYEAVDDFYEKLKREYIEQDSQTCSQRQNLDLEDIYNQATDIEFSTQIMRHQTLTEKRKMGCEKSTL